MKETQMYFIGPTSCRGTYFFYSKQHNGWIVADLDTRHAGLHSKLATITVVRDLSGDITPILEDRLGLGQDESKWLIDGDELIPFLRDHSEGIKVNMVYYADGEQPSYSQRKKMKSLQLTYPLSLYADGGVIGSNPSKLGGTWAWCAVNELDKLVRWDAGIVTPADLELKTATNNATELLAVVNAIAATPSGWNGIIYTDSRVTALRITKGFIPQDASVPKWLRQKLWNLKERRKWRVVLVRGHPTKDQLANGWSNGLPVSKWNCFVDRKCSELAKSLPHDREGKNTQRLRG